VTRLLSFAVFVAIWWIASLFAGDVKLPPPPTVLAVMVAEAKSGNLFFHLGATLARVTLAFTLAMALGTAIGYLMGRVRLADRLGDPWLILLLNLPALVVIVLAYIWAGLTEVAAIAAIAINKLPNAVVTLREGTRALDATLDEMATVFALPRWSGFATSFCRNWLLTSPPPRAPAFRWSGRSFSSRNCSDARTASVSRSASRSSYSTFRSCWPTR
jgi:NitT/TauT family transport system permease protein